MSVFCMENYEHPVITTFMREMVDSGGVWGLFGARIGAAGVHDASRGSLGHERGSVTRKSGSDGEFWTAMT